MKKSIILTTALFLVMAVAGFAQHITGSAHDFSGQSWSGGQICLPCHAPHGNLNSAGNLLWNHAASSATYTVYSNAASLNATIAGVDGSSKLCLSCHDGTVAVDKFGTNVGGAMYATGGDNLGNDLSNDHPISFTYDDALATADGGLKAPTTTLSGVGSGHITDDMLQSNKLQCSSCHDVHNKYNQSHLLLKANTASALCLTCHTK